MRLAIPIATLALLAVGCRSGHGPIPGHSGTGVVSTDPFAVVAEADRLAGRDLWPGFDARDIPVAIYDGKQTLLFRHPTPPEGFEPVPGRPKVRAYIGRHPDVTANSSADLGGVLTATLIPPASEASLQARAGLLIHEAFHVFQRERHPGWNANEVELFTYPVDDPELLALRRLETEALRRAVTVRDEELAACWARYALDLRGERFQTLSEGSLTYERQVELTEGLATYVERRALGELAGALPPAGEFAPDEVRSRAYETGVLLALLLDRFSPSWRAELARSDAGSLDALLSTALGPRRARAPDCAFPAADRDRIRASATLAIRELQARRAEERRGFLEQPGWRLVFIAAEAPLFPQVFDPLNVRLISDDEVLHTRFVKMGNASGTIEVLGWVALSEAAGAHPLFSGVHMFTVTGLPAEPAITEADGTVTVAAEGVAAELNGATVERNSRTVTVRLPPSP